MKSDGIWNVRLGEDQGFARQEQNAFIWTAAGARWQLVYRLLRDVDSDDGEVAGVEFEYVRAALERDGARAIGVRVRAESAQKFG